MPLMASASSITPRERIELLLDHRANINSKDRSKMTALQVAVTGGHKDVVSLLLARSTRIKGKAFYEQLLELQEQLFAARYENQSRQVDTTIKILASSPRLPPVFRLGALYVRHLSRGRWAVLQDLVKNNEAPRSRKWTQSFIKFGIQLVVAKNPSHLTAIIELSVRAFEVVSSADLEALLVIGVMVGSSVMLAAAQHQWREGVEIAGRTFSQFTSLGYRNGAQEWLDYGVRQFLIDFDDCIRGVGAAEGQSGRVADEVPSPITYGATVIREYLEGYMGGRYEEQPFNDTIRAWASELGSISESQDSRRLFLLLSSILNIIHSAREKGRDWFLNLPPVACRTLCRNGPGARRWLIEINYNADDSSPVDIAKTTLETPKLTLELVSKFLKLVKFLIGTRAM
ncbi:hypothetical protein GGR58DRAFT_509193 [Xylaria digitata]|nr:hypothetical protein GGR58DRAFT_509193 [Xylaria digitata]